MADFNSAATDFERSRAFTKLSFLLKKYASKSDSVSVYNLSDAKKVRIIRKAQKEIDADPKNSYSPFSNLTKHMIIGAGMGAATTAALMSTPSFKAKTYFLGPNARKGLAIEGGIIGAGLGMMSGDYTNEVKELKLFKDKGFEFNRSDGSLSRVPKKYVY